MPNVDGEATKPCISCSDEIRPESVYFKCEKATCKSDDLFCKHCNGCPEGHMILSCSLREPLEPEESTCLWCEEIVEPQNNVIRLCFDCLRPVCHNRCSMPPPLKSKPEPKDPNKGKYRKAARGILSSMNRMAMYFGGATFVQAEEYRQENVETTEGDEEEV